MASFKSAGKFLFAALKVMVPKVQEVEDDIKAIKAGKEKRAKVVEAVLDGLAVAEDLTGKDLLKHPKVKAVVEKANDQIVQLQKDVQAALAEAARDGN